MVALVSNCVWCIVESLWRTDKRMHLSLTSFVPVVQWVVINKVRILLTSVLSSLGSKWLNHRDTQAFEKQDNYFFKLPGILIVYSKTYFFLSAPKQRQNVLIQRFTL